MREYRDDLAAAQARIAVLEGMVEATAAPRSPAQPASGTGVARAILLVAGTLVFAYLVALGPGLFSTPARSELTNPSSEYSMTSELPTLLDVDGDGTRDVVTLLWRLTPEGTQLYVAAIDGKTFRPQWMAGPYPNQMQDSRTHLVVAGTKVIVTDTEENLRVLDLDTGHQISNWKIDGKLTEVCAFRDGGTPGAIVRTTSHGREGKSARFFMAEHDMFGDLPAGASCPTRSLLRDSAIHDGARPVALDGDELANTEQSTVRGQTSYVFYAAKSGPFRVVARSATSGRVKWHATVRNSHFNSSAASGARFTIDGDLLIVVMGGEVHLFDAGTGEYLAVLDSTTR